MNRLYFLMAIHFHQPVGNFEFIIRRVCQEAYQPFLETLEEFPDIKLTFHISGCLLEWFNENEPKLLDKIAKFVNKGQVELMTGGFYEPILPMIPETDRLGQIALMTSFLRQRFKYEPAGFWVAERIWEPELSEALADAGVKYVILDDSHLKKAGVLEEKLCGYYIAENRGKEIAIFASNKKLRYAIPFHSQQETLDYLAQIAGRGEGLAAVYADDAEKFGAWPGTYEPVHHRRWLYNFFLTIREENSWLKTAHVRDYLKGHSPLGKVDIPATSYDELNKWSQDDWRNFFKKYPEAEHMKNRMVFVSDRLKEAEKKIKNHRRRLNEARLYLYKGQCNCGYWHGLFGGLYLPRLRASIYKNLIAADEILDELGPQASYCLIKDFDNDGRDEIILANSRIWLLIDPDEGGAISELDLKKIQINLINTLARRKEPYHKKGVFYDKRRRVCLIDHFFDDNVKIKAFSSCQFEEKGDFVNSAFGFEKLENKIILSRQGQVNKSQIELAKSIQIKKDCEDIHIEYRIKNLSTKKIEVQFGSEFNFFLTEDDVIDQLFGERSLVLRDPISRININISFSEPADIWRFPIKTISQSENKPEEHYQSTTILPYWKLNLPPTQTWSNSISLRFAT